MAFDPQTSRRCRGRLWVALGRVAGTDNVDNMYIACAAELFVPGRIAYPSQASPPQPSRTTPQSRGLRLRALQHGKARFTA